MSTSRAAPDVARTCAPSAARALLRSRPHEIMMIGRCQAAARAAPRPASAMSSSVDAPERRRPRPCAIDQDRHAAPDRHERPTWCIPWKNSGSVSRSPLRDAANDSVDRQVRPRSGICAAPTRRPAAARRPSARGRSGRPSRGHGDDDGDPAPRGAVDAAPISGLCGRRGGSPRRDRAGVVMATSGRHRSSLGSSPRPARAGSRRRAPWVTRWIVP